MIQPDLPQEPRSASEILSRSLPLTFGGKQYILAVLTIAGNERWRAYEQERTAAFMESVEGITDNRQIIALFTGQTDIQLDLIYAYDTDCGRREGVLPPVDELKEVIYEDEVDQAMRRLVWASNPKAVAGVRTLQQNASPASTTSPPSNRRQRRTAGRPSKSGKN